MAGPGVIDTAAFAGADTAPASGTTSAQDHRPQPQQKRPKLVLPNPIAHAAVKSTTREELLADGGKKSNVPGKAPEASAGAPSVSNTVSEPCVPAATSNATSIPISDPTSTLTPSLVPTHGSGSPLESPPESSHTGPVVIEDTMTSEPVPASGTGPVLATMTTGPSCESPLPSVVDETNPILPVASTSSDTGLQTSGITQPKLDLAVSSAAVDKVTGKGLARRVWLGENPTKSEKDFETYWKEQTKIEPETFAKEWNKTARQHNAQNKHKTTSKASTRGSRTKRGTVGAIA